MGTSLDDNVTHEPDPRDPRGGETLEDVARAKGGVTRRQVLVAAGCGVAGLVAGGVLAKWGVVSDAVASGRIDIATTPQKMIVTDRARCSGCQRCEMMCTLKNDGMAMQSSARVRVHETYFFGDSPDTGEGSFGSCQFTIKSCRQCAEPRCVEYCPVHAIHSDDQTGTRVIEADVCIGCGMCHEACPWGLPKINPLTGVSTKCVSCGRCAEQCPNGAIQFIDWIDIAQECIDKGLVSTVYAQGR